MLTIVIYLYFQVWISFAQFERTSGSDNSVQNTRAVYKEANKALGSVEEKEERQMLLESWQTFEVRRWHIYKHT